MHVISIMETTTKTNYSWPTYKWLSNRTGNVDDMWRHINKYQLEKEEGADWFDDLFYSTGDGKSTLDPEDDAATANWGTAWKTPDEEQINELFNLNNCSREWKVRNDGITGVLFISKRNGKRIFLPAAGYRTGYDLRNFGTNGYYASSQIEDPYRFREIFVHYYIDPVVVGNTIYSSNYFCFQWNTADRSNGYTVRPVLVKKRKR